MAWGSAHGCIYSEPLPQPHFAGQGPGVRVLKHTCMFGIHASCCCRHFNMVVIDEATQATEPATLVPLTQVCACVCVCACVHSQGLSACV